MSVGVSPEYTPLRVSEPNPRNAAARDRGTGCERGSIYATETDRQPEEKLWRAVIAQAFEDAQCMNMRDRHQRAAAEARAWLTNQSPGLTRACDFAGMDVGAVIRVAKERAERGWPRAYICRKNEWPELKVAA